MHIYTGERLALFIDGPALSDMCHALNFKLDYKRLLLLFRERGQLVTALYFTSVVDDGRSVHLQPLLDWLSYNGFTVVTKLTKPKGKGGDIGRETESIAVELSIRAVQVARSVDHIVLVSGNGDLRCLVDALQGSGKRVSVVSTLRSSPSMISDALRRQVDQFIELAELIPIVSADVPSPAVASAS